MYERRETLQAIPVHWMRRGRSRPISRPCLPPRVLPRTCHDIAIPACHVFLSSSRRRNDLSLGETLTPCHFTMLLLRFANALLWLPPDPLTHLQHLGKENGAFIGLLLCC